MGVSDLGNTLGWLADAQRETGDMGAARSSRERQLALYQEQLAQAPGDSRTLVKVAHTRAQIASLATDMGEDEQGAQFLDLALDSVNALYEASPDNDRYARLYVSLIFQRAQIALMRDDLIRAQLLIGEARRLAARTNENGENDGRFLSRSAALTLSASLALKAGSYDTAVLEATQAVSAGEQSVAAGSKTRPEEFPWFCCNHTSYSSNQKQAPCHQTIGIPMGLLQSHASIRNKLHVSKP